MFTGIIESVAVLKASQQNSEILELTIQRPNGWKLHDGQSIAVDGVCLTVTTFNDDTFTVELMPESTRRTTFGGTLPTHVNLERAMSPDGLFEGHIVQGHADGLSTIIDVREDDQWRTLRIAYKPEEAGFLVDKGSVTIDGISLTIVEVSDKWFSVSLIPHTIAHTTLGTKKQGDAVNLEFDVVAKLIARQFQLQNKTKEA